MHLIYIFLIADIIDHIFMCSLACHASFLRNIYPDIKVCFLFLLLIYENYLYILDTALSQERDLATVALLLGVF